MMFLYLVCFGLVGLRGSYGGVLRIESGVSYMQCKCLDLCAVSQPLGGFALTQNEQGGRDERTQEWLPRVF